MDTLRSFLAGSWCEGEGAPVTLENPATGAPLAQVRAVGSLARATAWGRQVGGPAVRALSYTERGERLSALAKVMHEHREELLALSVTSGGNTRGDAKFDVDGAAGVLAHYARLAPELGEHPWRIDEDPQVVLKTGKLRAQQILAPRLGLAVQINAFNFPAWGMVGKLAVAFLAGMPTLAKPATATAALAHRIAELFLESGHLPEGSFQLLMGSAGDLLDHLGPQDVIAFTGSAATGRRIRTHENVLTQGVRVNVEADSLNAAIVGPDVTAGTEVFDALVRDLVTEMTQKAGQKCTAIRRILAPPACADDLVAALSERLQARAEKTGDPALGEVRMGPLTSAAQLADARAGLSALQRDADILRGDPTRTAFLGVDEGQGHFLEPVLLRAKDGRATDPKAAFHHTEVFGPVSTILPYDGSLEQAAAIVALGGGSLQSTLYTSDRGLITGALSAIAPLLGRLVVVDEKGAAGSIPPGGVLPQVHHGGPGRAGDGSELGGVTGLALYQQRVSIQASAGILARTVGK